MPIDPKVAQLILLAEDIAKVDTYSAERITEARANSLRGIVEGFKLRAKAILSMERQDAQR
jgi:hypothetical protein